MALATLPNPPLSTSFLSGALPSHVWARWLQLLRDNAARPLILTPYTAASPLVVPTDWTTVTAFANGFTQYTSVAGYTVRYRKYADGSRVEGKGVVNVPATPPAARSKIYGPLPWLPDVTNAAADAGSFAVSANGTALADIRVDSSGNVLLGTFAVTGGGYLFVDFSYVPADRTPAPLSCFPFTVKLPSGFSPTAVLAQCAPTTAPTTFASYEVAWSFARGSNGAPGVLTINNILGLPPSTSYVVTLLVF